MVTLPAKIIKPKDCLSAKAIPEAIRKAVCHIFQNCGTGIWLVGGTALAGYYAEHRRSDDIDLFSASPDAHHMAILAVKSLQKIGAKFSNEKQTPLYYRVDSEFLNHSFTIDVVLDEHLHETGKAHHTTDGAYVADIQTLLAMKVACLVSRCSEKDMFDLIWLFEKTGEISTHDLIELGTKVDGGVSVETLLISIHGAIFKKESCRFLLPHSKITAEEAYRKILKLQKKLVSSLLKYEKTIPLEPGTKVLAGFYRDIKKKVYLL